MTAEQIIIAAIAAVIVFALGMYVARKTATSPDTMRATAYGSILEAVTLAKQLKSGAPAEAAAAAAKAAHEASVIASLKAEVADL